jgi:hypothetical protein
MYVNISEGKVVRKAVRRPAKVGHTSNSRLRRLRQEDYKFEASFYIENKTKQNDQEYFWLVCLYNCS